LQKILKLNTENNKADANKCVCLIYWEGVNEMIILQRDSRYEMGDPDCVFKVKSGDLITPIKRIGYKTTFDDWEDYGEITDEDIKDLYIFCCPNDEYENNH